MNQLRSGYLPIVRSYWLDTSTGEPYPPLAGTAKADVAVIGGGVAGVCCAWELSRAGRDVILLEAGRLLSGVTGHTTAKLTAQHTLLYHRLSRETARLYAQAQTDAIEHVAAQKIECDLEFLPAYAYSSDVDEIRKEAEAEEAAGLAASFVTEVPLPGASGRAAVKVEGQAQFHPLRYLRALAADVPRIHENSRVVDIDGGTVKTDGGATVNADVVVVATHFPILDKVALVPRLSVRRDPVIAAPIPSSLDPQGMFITREEGLRSVRTAPFESGRLLIVTGETYAPGEPGVRQRITTLASWASERFGVTEFPYVWSAHDFNTADGVPFIGHFPGFGDNVFVATGFGGWGMTNGVAAGRLIASLVDGEPLPWAKIFDPKRLNLKESITGVMRNAANAVGHLLGDRTQTPRLQLLEEDVPPGEGRVLMVDERRIAIYHDPRGGFRAVSATCTHLGCVVGFNDAEATWDCPCHGSRFALDGSIISGPALKPLAPEQLPE